MVDFGIGIQFNLSQEAIVVTLKSLMIRCTSAKIKNKLHGTNNGDGSTGPNLIARKPHFGSKISRRRSSKNYHEEVKSTIPRFVDSASRRMVERISKYIEF